MGFLVRSIREIFEPEVSLRTNVTLLRAVMDLLRRNESCSIGPTRRRAAVLAAAAVLLCGQSQAFAAQAPGPDVFGYTVQLTTAYRFVQITNAGTPRVLWFDDDTPYTASLGFSFNFYGTNYSAVSFNPNGLMTFGGPSSDYANVDLTTASPSNNLPAIAVLWDDWETQETWADGVYYKTIGPAGSRQFIVQWNNVVPVNGDGTNTVTFEARLFEGSNRILFSYFDTVVSDESTPVASLGVGATVGIRDLNGQVTGRALQWSYNQPVITNGLNLLFTPPNQPPKAANFTVATMEDTPVTINVLANGSDPDADPLTLISVSQCANGLVTTNVNGTVSFSPATNFFGTDQFTYVISDGRGSSATGVVSVIVQPVNDFPTLDPLNDMTLQENAGPQRVSLTGITAGALNESHTLVVTAYTSNSALIASLMVNYTNPGLTGTLTFNLATNAIGKAFITVTVNNGDPTNNLISRSFAIIVNHPPIANPDFADTYKDIPLNVSTAVLLANDSDPDPGAVLSVTDASPISSSGGSVILFGQTITYTPPSNFIGSDTFIYTLSDGQGGQASGIVGITVWPSLTIASIERLSDSTILIRFHGIPGRKYDIEGADDLSNWNGRGLGTENNPGEFEFNDTGTAGLSMRFYRLRGL